MAFTHQIAIGASQDRLEKLISQRVRSRPEAQAEIDRRIWDLFGEQWAIMFTDLSGFSRGVEQFGIIHFLQTIFESVRILIPCIEDNDGILLKTEGDSMLVIFRNVQKAINCSIQMQRAVLLYDADKGDTEKILLGIGLGYGRVLRIGDADVFGEEVNSASKLGEDCAKPWEILVTESVRESGSSVPGVSFEPVSHGDRSSRYKLAYALK